MNYFVALDGEGINNKYCLLQDSQGGELLNLKGIGTEEVFDFLFERQAALRKADKKPVFIGFGLSYDCNMMFKDIDDKTLAKILQPEEKEFVLWKVSEDKWYEILYFPRKLLRIKRHEFIENGEVELSDSLVLYDTFSFFGTSFVKALKGFFGNSLPGLKKIEAGKKARAVFQKKDLPTIKKYNKLECELLVDLCNKLKDILEDQGIHLNKWHGPGAVADFLLGKKGYNVHEDYPNYEESKIPIGLLNAWDCSYYGGRIENIILGSVRPVFTYDINSAYPYAISKLPIMLPLDGWDHYDGKNIPPLYTLSLASVARVSWDIPKQNIIGPFPWRDKTGRIFFPNRGEAWVWKPEIAIANKFYPGKIKILEVWTQRHSQKSRLSKIIPDLYNRRLALKEQGNPSEYAIKIALNSLYGKFAQRSGRRPYFCIPWAGLITSMTRAMLFEAAMQKPRDILAFATDSIFSKTPLHLPIGKKLGQWKAEEFTDFLCIMSGFYRLGGMQRKGKSATRGVPIVDGENISWNSIIESLNNSQSVSFAQRIFVTHNLAMHFHKKFGDKRLTFVDDEKTLDPFNAGKRDYLKDSLKDWNKESVSSFPPLKEGLSFPSSLSFDPKSLVQREQEFAEIEAQEVCKI